MPSPSFFAKVRERVRSKFVALMKRAEPPPLAVGIVGTVLAFVVVAVSFVSLNNERADALAHARTTSANLALVVSKDLHYFISLSDVLLRDIEAGAEDPSTPLMPADVRERLKLGQVITGKYFVDAQVIDQNGHVVAAQLEALPPDVRLDDRSYFLTQAQRAGHVDDSLYISRPFASRYAGDVGTVALSRRIDLPNGGFGGVAMIALRTDYFQDLIADVKQGDGGMIAIAYDDGELIARQPWPAIATHGRLAPEVATQIAGRVSGSFDARGVDGVERVYSFRRVPDSPFTVIVAPGLDHVLSPWRSHLVTRGGISIAVGLILIAASWLLAVNQRARMRVEAELQSLSTTDPLTGLNNRRALERKLGEAWARGRRTQTPLSMLFVDIDRFRLFNEQYGHQVGDQVLAAVARTLNACCRRATDFAARYGGEEFTIVLPDTDERGAARLAELAREAVQRLAISHDGSEHGSVTVSIGCATCVPDADLAPEDLVSAADAALYRAKAAGRNRVWEADEVGAALIA
jgi:diguanylate cyclase (GGDEF)-like protein